MASDAILNVLRLGVRDLSLVLEIYASDTVPGTDGFDPADAELCLSDVSGITFAGQLYQRYVTKWGDVSRTISPTFNSFTFSLDNSSETQHYIAAWVLSQTHGVAGFHVVLRVISRSQSVDLADSYVWFVGRLEKPVDAKRPEISFSAKSHIGSLDQDFPRRKFGPDDSEGRLQTDPLFEGFLFSPQQIQVNYQDRVSKGGLLGLLGFKKNVTRTLAYSSYSDVDSNTYVPEVLGRTQIEPKVLGGVDEGTRILAVLGWCEGPIYGYSNHRILTPNFTFQPVASGTNPGERYGEEGGSTIPGREQVPNAVTQFPGDGYYSYLAATWEAYLGSKNENQDPVPGRASLIIGRIIPTPTDGEFPDYSDSTVLRFSDNPSYLSRWLLTVHHGFNLPPGFIDDDVCIETAGYCDHFLEDEANTDRVFVEQGIADLDFYKAYFSTGRTTPEWWRFEMLADDTVEPWTVEARGDDGDYETFDQYDVGSLDVTPVKRLRRRFTCNVPLTDSIKVIDLLYKIIFQSARLYLTQGSNGKIQIRAKKPVDNTILSGDTAAGATEVPVQSVMAWMSDLSGKVLIGHTLTTSEVRTVTDIKYSADGNSITLAVSGALTRSGATFTGGDDDTAATASVVVTGTGGGTITIDGVAIAYTGLTNDVIGSVAGQLAAGINANPTLNPYVGATWDAGTSDTINLISKLGSLVLDRALSLDHDELEEVIRVRMSFSDAESDQADCTRANLLKGQTTWPGGSQQSQVSRVTGTFRDASQDYKATPMIIKDDAYEAQTNRKDNQDVDLSAIDNHHQATRVLNGELAELRDGDFFMTSGADGEALTLQEGEVVCVTEASGGFVNLAIRVESLTFKSDFTVGFTGRRYLNSMYDDTVEQKNIPLPTTLANILPQVPVNIMITNDGIRAWVTWNGLLNTTYQLATDTTGVESTFLFNGPGGHANFAVLDGMTTVYLRSVRNGFYSVWKAIDIPGAGTVVAGRPAPYNLVFTATGPTTATATWVRNATDNDDVSYSLNGAPKVDLGSATVVTNNFTGLTADTDYSLEIYNKWSSGTTYSGPSETRAIHTPITTPDSNDPIDLRIENSSVNPHGVCSLDFVWNPQSGTNPTLHFTNYTSPGLSHDYNPTTSPVSQHITPLGQGQDWSAYVTNSDGSNPSNTVYGTTETL